MENYCIAFLARHGVGHHIPFGVNYRANIYALKSLGVERIISISACGSLHEDYALAISSSPTACSISPATGTFFEALVAHISSAEPFCPDLSRQIYEAALSLDCTAHLGGTFITIEGPRFSTKAESNVFRSWGMSIIGMTASPEAFWPARPRCATARRTLRITMCGTSARNP